MMGRPACDYEPANDRSAPYDDSQGYHGSDDHRFDEDCHAPCLLLIAKHMRATARGSNFKLTHYPIATLLALVSPLR